MDMTVDEAWAFKQILHPVSTVGSIWTLVETGQVVSADLFNNIMIFYMYTAQGQGKTTFTE